MTNEVPKIIKWWIDKERDKTLEKGLRSNDLELASLYEQKEEQKADLEISDDYSWEAFGELLLLKIFLSVKRKL